MKQALLMMVFAVAILWQSAAQERSCGTMKLLEEKKTQDSHISARMDAIELQTRGFSPTQLTKRGIITLPIVIHILYSKDIENLSEAQILSQLTVLNSDFRAQNTDKSLVHEPFKNNIADVGIEFCLAKQDPSGNATTGIIRKQVERASWGTSDDMKKSSFGGSDPWNTAEYINIWICNIGGGALGFSQLPGVDADTDGLVIDYRYFGTRGTVHVPFDKGRTVTHELGHYFNLRHIWGDMQCGDDFVEDTPQHSGPHFGCPAYPAYSSCEGNPLKLTTNFMDYVNDNCMVMFTDGQKNRMLATLAANGPRYTLLNSKGCIAPEGVVAIPNSILPAPPTFFGIVPPPPCNLPQQFNIREVTVSSVKVDWASVPNAQNYTVRIKADNSPDYTAVTTKSLTANFTALLADQAYTVQIQSGCGTNVQSTFSSAKAFRTEKPVCGDNYEPNNSRSYATDIVTNKVFNAQIATIADADWLRFAVTKDQTNIKLELYNLAADFDLKLYRSDGVQIAVSERANKDAERIVLNNLPIGAYFARVYGYATNTSTECYALNITTSASNFRIQSTDNATLPEKNTAEGEMNFVNKSEKLSFKVYPNPSDGMLTLSFESDSEKEVVLLLRTVTGLVVKEEKIAVGKHNTNLILDYYGMPSGMYLMQVISEKRVATQKIFIE
jgi:hypothetical protein